MLNRLMGIIYLLMNRGMVTAKELAERYEVSVRTIYRDIDVLCMAGIPIYTKKGKNGGIGLAEQFVLNKMLVTKEEQQQILAALSSLEETGAQHEGETIKKLGEFFNLEPSSWVAIDMSDWSGRRQALFGQIKDAIIKRNLLEFDYYGQNCQMSRRTVEPIQLLFKEYTWYLRAYCRNRQAMRVFKILRMKRVTVMEEKFSTRQNKEFYQEEPHISLPKEEITLWIDAKEAYRIYDRFEEEEIHILDDGSFQIQMCCVLDDWLYGMILSFGDSAKVIEPVTVREEIKRRLMMTLKLYQ